MAVGLTSINGGSRNTSVGVNVVMFTCTVERPSTSLNRAGVWIVARHCSLFCANSLTEHLRLLRLFAFVICSSSVYRHDLEEGDGG